MKQDIKTSKFIWIDINKPSERDIKYLKKRFRVHPLILDELINPSPRPRAELHKNYVFMVLYYPMYNIETRETSSRELNIIISKKAIITSHNKVIPPLKTLFDSCKFQRQAQKTYLSEGTGQVLYYIINAFWKNCFKKIEKINERIDNIQKDIFSGKEKEMVLEISLVKTDIINFWRIIEPQKEIIESLLKEGLDFFGKPLLPYFSDILGTYERVSNALETNKETILALEDTNQSLLSTRINEIMKVLTIFSVILLPLTLIASIWGMNFPLSLPFANSSMGFWQVSGIMLITLVIMIFYFRKRKWL
ncbi:MAG: magnesium transporter CorA family protein [Candidatus Nealsonbacteria bacterium]